MKLSRHIGIIFILSAVFFLSGCFDYPEPPQPPLKSDDSSKASDASQQWQIYENSRYYFSLVYPPGWTLGEAPTNNDGRHFTSADGKTTCSAYGFQNALMTDDGDTQTMDEYLTWITDDPYVEVKMIEDTTMAGVPAKEIIYGQMGKVTRAVFILGSESGRGLTCTYDNLKEEEMFRESFRTMKESFEVKAPMDS